MISESKPFLICDISGGSIEHKMFQKFQVKVDQKRDKPQFWPIFGQNWPIVTSTIFSA